MDPDKEQAYRMTVKGWLMVRLGRDGVPWHRAEAFWDELTEYVSKQAKANGCEGIPCLVLHDGGHCITAEAKPHDPALDGMRKVI